MGIYFHLSQEVPRNGIAGSKEKCMFNFTADFPNHFQKCLHHFTPLSTMCKSVAFWLKCDGDVGL